MLRHPSTGEELDRGLILFFNGPNTVTGEDLAELHLHGGRAVIDGVLDALKDVEGLRAAAPGEFTRRAFENGRVDLAEAEGLADLLAAETVAQRRAALTLAGGALSQMVEDWQSALLAISAAVEAELDFSDEGDVEEQQAGAEWRRRARTLADAIAEVLARPRAERLKDGIKVVVAGPPNAGKSTLINALAAREVAITSPVAGTTRDRIEVPLAVEGVPLVLIDTAGLRDSIDPVEAIGIERARESVDAADIIVWLGELSDCPDVRRSICISPKADIVPPTGERLPISALAGTGLTDLLTAVVRRARGLLPPEGTVAINRRHHALLVSCLGHITAAEHEADLLVVAEELRLSRMALDEITGRAGTEDMLDVLFGLFCVGK